jgi:hypothetical protein
MPAKKDEPELPSTLLRSAQKVQDAYEKTLEPARLEDEKGASDPPPENAHGGVDATKTKAQLMGDARAAGIEGRSKMDKDQLVEALEQHVRRATDTTRG